MGVGRCGDGVVRFRRLGQQRMGSPSSPGGRGVRVCRNIKLNPSLHVEDKDHRLPRCPNETTPLNMTTVNHKTRKVLELEGQRRASSPAQGQTSTDDC